MNLSSFVSKNMVTVNLRSSTKRAVIAEIVGYICSRLGLTDKNLILQSVLDREEKASTGIGDGVAIPHSRLPHLERVLFFVGISKPGVDFGSPDGKAAHVVFLFVTPEVESQTHLKILSAIGNLQKNSALLEKLRAAKTDAELFDILNFEQVQRESFYPLSREEVFRELETSEAGLTDFEARSRLEVYGGNRIHIIGTTPLVGRFLKYLVVPPNLPLWAAALLAFAAGIGWLGFTVLAVLLLNTGASFAREFKSDRTVDTLRNYIPAVSKVIRGERERRIATENLVPGDILLLDEGDTIPADGRLIEADELRVDNSAFSGDPKPVYKSHEAVKNREQYLWMEVPALVFAGTGVLAGSGKAVVTSTGMDTELGQIAYLTQTIKDEPSTLQRELGRFSWGTSIMSLVLLAAALLASVFLGGTTGRRFSFETVLVPAIGIILALSSIGLLPGSTLLLVTAARRMRKRGAIIKKLSSIESLGRVDVICTDKTGTLTSSEMCVRKLWLGGRVIDVEGEGYLPIGGFREGPRSIHGVDLGNSDYRVLFYDAALCNNAELLPPDELHEMWSIQGDPTEGALLALSEKAGMDVRTIRDTYPPLRRFPFDSVRKRMSTVHAVDTPRSDKHRKVLLVKGAPHELLALCSKVLVEGKERGIDEELKSTIDRQIDDFAAEGMRVLGFAYRRLSDQQTETATVDEVEQELIFSGLTAMLDPPREDAAKAIESCRSAGVRVIMITGEYQLTALSIARKLRIVADGDARVVSGREVSEMNDDELRRVLEQEEIVFARVNPEHRLRIVETLRRMGKRVAATGDGISDAPVLKKADIGVAMGHRGNSVTRATAEMELSGDSFASIVTSIEIGRSVFSNIRAMAGQIVSSLLPQALSFVLFLLLRIPLPLSLSLLLLFNLLVNLLPALGLGTRAPRAASMQWPAYSAERRIFDRRFMHNDLLFRGLTGFVVALGAFLLVLRLGSPPYPPVPSTIFFLSMVAAQLAFFVSRCVSPDPLGRPLRLIVLTAAGIAAGGVAVGAVVIPGLRAFFHTSMPTPHGWLVVVAAFAVSYVVVEIGGAVYRAGAQRKAGAIPRRE